MTFMFLGLVSELDLKPEDAPATVIPGSVAWIRCSAVVLVKYTFPNPWSSFWSAYIVCILVIVAVQMTRVCNCMSVVKCGPISGPPPSSVPLNPKTSSLHWDLEWVVSTSGSRTEWRTSGPQVYLGPIEMKNCDIFQFYNKSPDSHDIDDIHVLGSRLRARIARRYTFNCQSRVT